MGSISCCWISFILIDGKEIMHYNPEISLGAIVEIAMFVVAICGLVIKLGKIEQKVDTVYDWFKSTVFVNHKNSGD